MFLILDKDESPIYLCVTMTELQPFFKRKVVKSYLPSSFSFSFVSEVPPDYIAFNHSSILQHILP